MKRLLVVVVLSLLAAALLPTSALATHTVFADGPPAFDFIHGHGQAPLTTPCGNVNHYFHINGSTSTPPTPATGIFLKYIPSLPCLGLTNIFFFGKITCLTAPGPTAAMNDGYWGGVINFVWINGTSGGIPGVLSPGMGVRARVIDNWWYGAGTPDRDAEFVTPAAPSCPPVPFATSPITAGDIRVHDGI